MYTLKNAIYAANILRRKFDKLTLEDLLIEMTIEKEHGLISLKTNVTD